jgi:lysophospholipase L1-like esterase
MHEQLVPFVEALKQGRSQVVVFFGDSITFGSQIDPNRDESLAFPAQWLEMLRERIPNAPIEAHNRGVPGNRLEHALERLDRDVLALQPDLVVIEFGINDCWEGLELLHHFETRLGDLVEAIRAGSQAVPVLLTANMMNYHTSNEARAMAWFARRTAQVQNDGWTDAYMEGVRRVAARLNVPLADGYARWQQARASGLDTDTLLANKANHPTREGHRLLALALLELVA